MTNPYTYALKSRKAITEFLIDHENYYRSMSTCSPLAWNVKAYGVNLDFDHLVEVYRKSEGGDWLDFPEWAIPAELVYNEYKDRLFDCAIESCRFTVQDSDAYTTLWSGKSVDVEYNFTGRSGGYVIIEKHNGTDLTRISRDEFPDYLDRMDFADLLDLYKLVVQNDRDFRREAVESEVEYQAAFTLIENLCGDVVRPAMTQLELAY
jgi:hypothetical protein